MHLSSVRLISKSVTSRGILNYQLLLLWIVFVSWSVGYSLGDPSCAVHCAAVKGDKDWFDSSSEETNLPGWCDSAPLDGENVAGKMQSSLFSVDEPVKGHVELLVTSPESTSARYGCESVEATHTTEIVVLGVIVMLILFIIGTTDKGRNKSSRKFPCGSPSCPNRSLLCIAFVLYSIAVFSKSVHGYVQTESRHEIALPGDRLVLDCFVNTSDPLEWYFTPYGSNVSELINGGSQADSNATNTFKIQSEEFGHATLIIDRVLTIHAGRYECHDVDIIIYKLMVEVTIMDPNPTCNQRPGSSSIICPFHYAGNVAPDFLWSNSENSTFCNESVNDASTIGSLRIKGYKSPVEGWRCEPTKDEGLSVDEITSPLNQAAVIEQNVRLSCSKQKDDTGFWFRNVPLSAHEILIYHKKLLRNGLFSVDESVPGRSDLLFSLSESTSGRYGCDSTETTLTAEVVVLDPQPTCSWERTTGIVNASCSIGFSGNWPPVIDWYNPMGTVDNSNNTITIPSHRVTSFMIVPLTGDPHERYFVTCSVKLRIEEKPQETTALNIPELLLQTCKVPIQASEFGPAAGDKDVPKLNDGMTVEKSAALSKSGYWQTESHYRIVLLGDRVELNCFANTSHPPEWYFKPYGSNESEFINGSSQDDSNVRNTYKIVNEGFGHVSLIIDRVVTKHAGTYECYDRDETIYKLSVEVTVVEPTPTCNQRAESSSIVCPFQYAGNMTPDFEWLTSENATFCNEFVNDSSTIASLRIKGYKNPAGRWRCKPSKDDGRSLGLSIPLNYAAVRGHKVQLNCSTQIDDTRYWFRIAPLSVEEMLIYHKKLTRNGLYTVIKYVPGRSDLLFTLWQRTAGRYGCDTGAATHTAEVILSDSQPSCSWTTESIVVNANCSISFSGNWPPVIDWTDADGKLQTNDTITIPNQRVTSFLTVPLKNDPHELYYVTCSVKFRIEDKPPETTATNIPVISPNFCRVTIEVPEYEIAANQIDVDTNTESPDYGNAPAVHDAATNPGAESPEHGDAAGAIDVDKVENIDTGPAASKKEVPKGNDGTAENDKPKPSIGSGRESVVLLQLFLAFIAAFVGLGQF